MSKANPIYLDYAAATPMDSAVLRAMEPYFSQTFYNPSATYLAGRDAKTKLSEARTEVAKTLGVRPAEVIFTAGASEANNLAISGVMNRYPKAEVLVSAIEHSSVLNSAKNYNYKEIPVNSQGIVDLQKLESMISDKTVLVSVMLVNNAIGSIQPVKEISQILNKLSSLRKSSGNKLPLYLHTDAAQATNYLDLHVSRLGVDLLTLNGDKIYGPKQSAVLYVKTGVELQPLIYGGGQEFGLRAGTENLASAVGLSVALPNAQRKHIAESKRLHELRQQFIKGLEELKGVTINGPTNKHAAPHLVSATFQGVDNERLMMELDERGIICGIGSACSAAGGTPSHVLKAIGLSDKQARSTLRFSFGNATQKNDIQKTLEVLKDLL